ncbi:NAD(P)-binding protein [Durotheca rogersii]|uniref:NAD(P)-binding protein n=1 Tax=Durotheca rogersii TaxID=419775 RepID=UPI002220B945|nr:NAD(P)-binding protein [Durotheca rogersii]KAI5864322.1 NAD(P)-binding protein [Durotheca rogersii]
MPTIAISGASGKLGSATLDALLGRGLAGAGDVIALTSAGPGTATWERLAARGVRVRHASFAGDAAAFAAALAGADVFFLVSTPHVALDYERPTATAAAEDGGAADADAWAEPPDGEGREAHHRLAIDAAARAGVRHVYYSSLAFAWGAGGEGGGEGPGSASRAGVMRAHLRTERYLAAAVAAAGRGGLRRATAIREGLYAESWPLYLGYFQVGADERGTVRLAADGRACWTAIADLGLATALLLAADDGEDGRLRTVYLATRPAAAKSVADVAALVTAARAGPPVHVQLVGAAEHERHYVEDRGMPRPAVRWWASTYAALAAGECLVDDPTLERLLASVGRVPTRVEDVVARMVGGG